MFRLERREGWIGQVQVREKRRIGQVQMREHEGRIGQVFRLERRNGWIGQVQVRVDEGRIG